MSGDSLFSVNDRVKYDNGSDFEPRWFVGTISQVIRGSATGYRVKWDDGYEDPPGSPLYFAGELSRG